MKTDNEVLQSLLDTAKSLVPESVLLPENNNRNTLAKIKHVKELINVIINSK